MSSGFADLLNYADFIDEGIIFNKDGAFLQCFSYHGPDYTSSSQQQIDDLTFQFNRIMTFLDDGWMIHLDVLRVPSLSYPTSGEFPHSILSLINLERSQQYEKPGKYFENRQFFSFVWKFPDSKISNKTQAWFKEPQGKKNTSLNILLKQFKEVIERCIGVMSTTLSIYPLTSQEQLSFLNSCIHGENLNLTVPTHECYLDFILGSKTLTGGFYPRIEDKYIYILGISGYINNETSAGLLQELCNYPLVYRWSNRFITLSPETAELEMKKYQKNWNNQIKGFKGILKEVISGKTTLVSNQDAADMSHEINSALRSNSNFSVRFGYWTSVIVLMHEQIPILENAKKYLRQYLEKNGFGCYLETVNALEAFLGSIPGHGSRNARRLFFSSLNLAHVLPLYSVWAGAATPENTLFNATTTGNSPFRFPLDIEGVGHQFIIGPTGSGKSTYLDFLIAQFLKFKNAQVFIFDKDYSHHSFTEALDGYHYDLNQIDNLSFCPFSNLNNNEDIIKASQFLESLVILQKCELTSSNRMAIHQAITLSCKTPHCSLSVISAQIQNLAIREALSYYTHGGPAPFLDGMYDNLKMGFLQTFEMGSLLKQQPVIFLPVLLHIFNQVEKRLDPIEGQFRPTLIVLEEAWLYISHSLFSNTINEWLKTLRKKNARVIFATQSLADLYDPASKKLTGITAQILESCPIRIYLANNKMDTEIRSLYEKIGLNDKQIHIISQTAIPKKDYYLTTPHERRLFDLNLDLTPLVRAFIGLTAQESNELLHCKKQHAVHWVYHWLNRKDLSEWANYWKQHYSSGADL